MAYVGSDDTRSIFIIFLEKFDRKNKTCWKHFLLHNKLVFGERVMIPGVCFLLNMFLGHLFPNYHSHMINRFDQ